MVTPPPAARPGPWNGPRWGVGLALALIAAAVVLRFAGMPGHYAVMQAFLQNPGDFAHDIYLNNTFFFDSSLYYTLVGWLRLGHGDSLWFPVYLGVTAAGLFYLYAIVRDFCPPGPLQAVLGVVLVFCFFGRSVPLDAWGGVIPLQPGSATMFAKALGFMALYQMLKGRLLAAALLVTGIVSIHVLADFILGPILLLYILFHPGIDKRKLWVLALPGAFIVIKAMTTLGAHKAGADPATTMEAVMAYGGQDANFFHRSALTGAFFIAFIGVFPLLWRRFDDPAFVALAKAVYWASVAVAAVGIFYVVIGREWFAQPEILMLGPVRAMKYFAVMFYLMSVVLIFRSARLASSEKIAGAVALILFHGESWGGVIYPLVVLAAGFAAARLLPRFSTLPPLAPLSVLLIALMAAQVVRGGVYATTFDALGYRYLDRWTVHLSDDPGVWEAYHRLAGEPGRHLLVAIDVAAPGRYAAIDGKTQYWAMLARQSIFMGDGHHFYFKPKLWAEYLWRRRLIDTINARLGAAQPLTPEMVAGLRQRGVSVMVPAGARRLFSGWRQARAMGPMTLLEYGGQ